MAGESVEGRPVSQDRRCRLSGHSYEACRRRRRPTRSPSQSGWSTRWPSASRLLVDYKASQVNNLIQRPTHPQFGVEQLTQQVKPGMQYFLSADITGSYFCYPLQEGPQGGDLTCFLTHKGKYVFTVLPQGCTVSQDFWGPPFLRSLTMKTSRTTTTRESSGS